MYMARHEIEYFQHFLDNGVPHIGLMQFATGIDPSQVTFILDSWQTEAIPRLLRRYGFKDVKVRSDEVSAKTLILPKIVPVLHPALTQNFINRLALNHSVMDRVVLVSRKWGDASKPLRLINNQDAVEEMLKRRYGDDFRLFRASAGGIDGAIDLFQSAKLIIGSHGGAMYNALWANRQAKVVELMPVSRGGDYPGQGTVYNTPPFAHLAIYTNSFMNAQQFFRWYEARGAINFDVDIPRFEAWLDRIGV
jgi:capsular polysaccharide biosynthesis protein